MTPKEKAISITNIMLKSNHVYEDAMDSAISCVDEIISSLTQYGKDSNELQNMDIEFNYWDKVKQEIEKL